MNYTIQNKIRPLVCRPCISVNKWLTKFDYAINIPEAQFSNTLSKGKLKR